MSNKYALLIGINKYPPQFSSLRGCVNDTESMYRMLTTVYKYDPNNIRVINDERASRQGILDRLNWLVKSGAPGDQLVFHFSGHGSQIADRNRDEVNDFQDEILCPADMDWDDPLTDDILAGEFRRIRKGVNFTFIADCCHSGTMNRDISSTPRFLEPPFDIRVRSHGRQLKKKKLGVKGIWDEILANVSDSSGSSASQNVHYSDQKLVLLSGCRDDQTSADAFIEGRHQGALTANLVKTIEAAPDKSAEEMHAAILKAMDGKYSQIPQLTGSKEILSTPLFGKK